MMIKTEHFLNLFTLHENELDVKCGIIKGLKTSFLIAEKR